MSKELTALSDLIELLEDEHLGLSENEWVVERKNIIETALKRLEEIDKYLYLNNKKLKALEIIKKKKVYIPLLSLVLDTYNLLRNEDEQLTQEEYDLLKEVLL